MIHRPDGKEVNGGLPRAYLNIFEFIQNIIHLLSKFLYSCFLYRLHNSIL